MAISAIIAISAIWYTLHFLVGNMMQSVVLDGNSLNEDEYMRLLTCVVLDGLDGLDGLGK